MEWMDGGDTLEIYSRADLSLSELEAVDHIVHHLRSIGRAIITTTTEGITTSNIDIIGLRDHLGLNTHKPINLGNFILKRDN